MTRRIKLSQIDEVMADAIQKLVRKTTLKWASLAIPATPVRVVYEGEPKGGGQLRAAWQTTIKKYEGTLTNTTIYAEPNIFGTNLPPSWGGIYRTRQNTIKGFPELQAKQLTRFYVPRELAKIIRRG